MPVPGRRGENGQTDGHNLSGKVVPEAGIRICAMVTTFYRLLCPLLPAYARQWHMLVMPARNVYGHNKRNTGQRNGGAGADWCSRAGVDWCGRAGVDWCGPEAGLHAVQMTLRPVRKTVAPGVRPASGARRPGTNPARLPGRLILYPLSPLP
jgi:hypothetical protein